jgi:LacI family transcriptional regulator
MRRNYIRSGERPVSMKDIARRANVSPSTVSRALRNNPWIPRWTRDRIKELAKEMGYVPSRAARDLAARKSWTVGVCVPDLSAPAVTDQANGLDYAATQHGNKLLVALSHGRERREIECVQDFQERRMDGIVILRPVATRSYGGAGADLFTPIVVIGGSDDTASESNYRRGRQAFEDLLLLMPSRVEVR